MPRPESLSKVYKLIELTSSGLSSEQVEALLAGRVRGRLGEIKGEAAERRVEFLLGEVTQEEEGEKVSFREATNKEQGSGIDLVIDRIGFEETYIPIQIKATQERAKEFRKRIKKQRRKIPVVVGGIRESNLGIKSRLRRIIRGDDK